MGEFEPPAIEPSRVHWLLRLFAGAVFAPVALFGVAASTLLIIDPQAPAARIGGIVLVALNLWVLSLSVRLVLNRPDRGGLLSPLALRIIAVYFSAMPIFVFITGRSSTWGVIQYLQAFLMFCAGIGLWRLALWRKSSNIHV